MKTFSNTINVMAMIYSLEKKIKSIDKALKKEGVTIEYVSNIKFHSKSLLKYSTNILDSLYDEEHKQNLKDNELQRLLIQRSGVFDNLFQSMTDDKIDGVAEILLAYKNNELRIE